MSDIIKKEDKAEVKKMEYIEFAPPSDVIENHLGITVLLDVPGATTERLSVNVEDRILKISADTDLMQHGKHVHYKRSFQISDEIALEKNFRKDQGRHSEFGIAEGGIRQSA